MLHTKYQSSRPSSVWEDFQRFCNFLLFGCYDNQTNGWNSISWTTLVELHSRNIPAKFHQDWPSGLGAEDVFRNCRRRTTHDRHWAIKKAHHEHFVLRWAKKRAENDCAGIMSFSHTVSYLSINLFLNTNFYLPFSNILLPLCHTILTFNDPGSEAFWKHCRKKKKMLVTSIISFSHNVFYYFQNKFHFSIIFILSSANSFNLDWSQLVKS